MTYVDSLLAKFRSKGLIVDTNLVVLALVGAFDSSLIGPDGFKRTRIYTSGDFRLLSEFTKQFQKVATTPHILTEASNLMGQLFGDRKTRCFEDLRNYIDTIPEIPIASSTASKRSQFTFLGLTDCALAELANEYLILTDDARCAKALNDSGLDVLNFNNLRTYVL